MRQEFEKWYVAHNIYCNFTKWNNKEYNDDYCSKDVQIQWETWQAGYKQKENEIKNLISHIEGINDERDSVPILLEIRKLLQNA